MFCWLISLSIPISSGLTVDIQMQPSIRTDDHGLLETWGAHGKNHELLASDDPWTEEMVIQ